MDVLTDMLALSGVRGTLGARIEAGSDWGWWSAQTPGAAFHAVTAGSAWLAIADAPLIQLLPGDLLLLPRGTEHAFGSDPDAVTRTVAETSDDYERADSGVVRIGKGEGRTHILCAHYEYDPAISTQVLAALPDTLHIRAESSPGGMEDTVRLLARELVDPQVATAAVLDSLVDILLIQVLRAWLSDDAEQLSPGALGALRDPVVGAAVARFHAAPGRPWTTASLAREIDVSRSTLARRFPAVVGETPGAYLTRWRMDLAARQLRDTHDSLEAIAQSVGYRSVYAFSRAFSRSRGVPPGRYRTVSRAGECNPTDEQAAPN